MARSKLLTAQQKWVKRGLYIIISVLLCSTVFAVTQLKNNSEIVSKSQNEAIWFVLQLTKEYSEFIFQLQNYQFGNSDHNDMMIQYEILWSRFNTIINNKQVMHFDQFKGAYNVVNEHFTNIKQLEPALLELPNTQNVQPLLDTFRDDYENLIIFLNHKFRLSSGDLGDRIHAISEIEKIIHYLLLSMLLIGVLTAFLLLRESHTHHKLAMNDSLTGIRNRLWLNHKLKDLEQINYPFNFYLIDLDGFKTINDTLGHHAGDKLLIELGQRLSELDCDSYYAARMGGDEFAIIELRSPSGKPLPGNNLDLKLIEALRRPARIGGKNLIISASIGVSHFPGRAKTISEVLRQADFAMYEVKQKGKDGLNHYQQNEATCSDEEEVIS